MKQLIIVGDGGHSQVIQDIAKANELTVVAIVDDLYDKPRHGAIVRAPFIMLEEMLVSYPNSVIVVAIGDNQIRKRIVDGIEIGEERYGTLIHPSAVIGTNVTIGVGTVVMANAVLNARATIGRHVIVNTGAIVEHDCCVGDFAHLSPQAAMAGAAKVDEGTHLGTGSVLIPKVHVGAWTTVGAGAVATKHIPQRCTAVGVPARSIKSVD
ncbi:acetyltransferase [Shouchella lonarensis]|uniref:Acetyltransferase EpsM n=1 Tax=Shouchella lonarensis TaxID=1464122 RepID=A0A1G6L8E0_9BACI|nr:acetyltransferase [Shouchella lonarensis]SDC39387.1 acetyltransferase EpsM [Shouchella lonarensis]